MNEPKYTSDQFAQMVAEAKPYLIQLEEEVQKVHDGFLEVKIDIRSGVVAKMTFFGARYWVKERESETKPLTVGTVSGKTELGK